MANDTRDQIREYYGQVLQSSNDLKTSACCCAEEEIPVHLLDVLEKIPDEVMEQFYGCGSPIPPALEGCTVLDLGCGTGRDVFTLSAFTGEQGTVLGLDMTDEQLDVAVRNRETFSQNMGYSKPNTQFLKGYMEDLKGVGIEDSSIDIVISNCVINLSPDKERVFQEIFRVLRPGGELLFSDVFADRRLPRKLMEDQVLAGECLAGAMYIEDFRRMLIELGIRDYRVLSASPLQVENQAVLDKVGMVNFSSITIRAFKLDALEDAHEDYGQVARYLGTIPHYPHVFFLDDHHEFETGRPMLVCGNTASMLTETRLAQHFKVEGNRDVHYGPFSRGSGGSLGSCACTSSNGCGCY